MAHVQPRLAAHAAIVREAGGDFLIEPIEIEHPRAEEVLVRIVGVGLCHTDVSVRDGIIPLPLPAVLGHEAAGIVEQVGGNVTHVQPGDHVVLTFSSCGACGPCAQDAPAHCLQFVPLNFAPVRTDGSYGLWQGDEPLSGNFFGQSSFATYALAHARNTVPVDPDVPLHLLGPLACGVQTGAGAAMRSFACPAGSSILITGGGSVGLSAVLGAVVQGCATIILSEPHAARRALAIELGATHAIDPAAGAVTDAVLAIAPGGVDFAFDTTGLPAVIEAAFMSLAANGALGLVGAPRSMTAIAQLPLAMLGSGRSVRGIIEGDSDPQRFIPEMIALYRAGRFPFDRLITTYALEAINQAVADHNDGRAIKPVLLTTPSAFAGN